MPSEFKEARKVYCPQCHAAMLWSTGNPYRPFCSERCKLIDFGQWATGSYRIPQQEGNNDQDGDDEQEL